MPRRAAIEGPLGWARATGDVADVAAITEGLGTRWEIARNTYKPYPAGIVFHAVIDACLELRARLDVPPEAIAASPSPAMRCCWRAATGWCGTSAMRASASTTAQRSACCAAAPASRISRCRRWTDPALAAFRAKVTAALDDDAAAWRGAGDGAAGRWAGGQGPPSSPRAASEAKPLTDAELEAKYHENAALGGCADRAAAQIDAIWALEEAPDLTHLMALLA